MEKNNKNKDEQLLKTGKKKSMLFGDFGYGQSTY